MSRPRPLPEPLRDGPFAYRAAIEAGVSDGRLRGRDLTAPFHGIRDRVPTEVTVEFLARAYLPRMRPDTAFSHATAALLRGFPLPLRFGPSPIHVSAVAGSRAPEGRGVRGHVIRTDVWNVDDLLINREDVLVAFPLTTRAVTWLTMAAALDVPDLVALGDAMLTGGGVTGPELEIALTTWGDGRGSRTARAALPLLRRGPMSRPESLLRMQIIAVGIPEPQINVLVTDRAGRPVFRPDLSWPDYRVLVEYEGDGHRLSRAKFRSDIDRMEAFADAGWTGLRATGDDVFEQPNRFLARLHRRLVERGLRLREFRQVAAAKR
jgi:hypothetical protein